MPPIAQIVHSAAKKTVVGNAAKFDFDEDRKNIKAKIQIYFFLVFRKNPDAYLPEGHSIPPISQSVPCACLIQTCSLG